MKDEYTFSGVIAQNRNVSVPRPNSTNFRHQASWPVKIWIGTTLNATYLVLPTWGLHVVKSSEVPKAHSQKRQGLKPQVQAQSPAEAIRNHRNSLSSIQLRVL